MYLVLVICTPLLFRLPPGVVREEPKNKHAAMLYYQGSEAITHDRTCDL